MSLKKRLIKIFQLKNKQGVILDISEKNLRTNLFSRMNIKIMFSNILRSLQSNKVHRYEFKNYKNYTDEEFKYLQKILIFKIGAWLNEFILSN